MVQLDQPGSAASCYKVLRILLKVSCVMPRYEAIMLKGVLWIKVEFVSINFL